MYGETFVSGCGGSGNKNVVAYDYNNSTYEKTSNSARPSSFNGDAT